MTAGSGAGPARRDNGLRAPAYVPLTDVAPEVGEHLLTALGRARIAAYLADPGTPAGAAARPAGASEPASGPTSGPASEPAPASRQRLFVASDERTDARTIVAAAVRALGEKQPELDTPPADEPLPDDPLAGIDTNSAFDALVADWHVDTHTAVREAEKELRREDAEWRSRLDRAPAEDPVWLDDDHYVPPPPPPLPRLAAPTVGAMVVLAVSVILLSLGGKFGLAANFAFVLGIVGLLLGAAMLFTRVRNTYRDEDDDGSAV